MSDAGVDREALVSLAISCGLDRVGICGVEPFPDVEASLRERVETGMSAGLGFTFARPSEAADVRSTHRWARSLIVGAKAYLPVAGDPGRAAAATGRVARFATEDHYRPLRAALRQVADRLVDSGHRAELMVDDSRLVDRAVATRAGIGWWGKNSMVLAPGIGPWFLIGTVVTDADLETDEPMRRDCGTCDACLPACPTGALIAPGVLDARRCLAAILQRRGSIPVEMREAVGDRIYGCDDCLDACPPGVRLLTRSASPISVGRHDVRALLALDDESLMDRFSHFYVPGRKARWLRRNLVVVLGNTGEPSDVPMLTSFLVADDPILRAHAAWALGRIGGKRAESALRKAHIEETEREVLDEIEAALGQPVDRPIGS